MKQLKQPGQFAAEETVTLRGPKGIFKKVRVLGPVRPDSQVEISKTDGFALGISAPVRESGVLDGTPGITLEGPLGTLELPRGVIVAVILRGEQTIVPRGNVVLLSSDTLVLGAESFAND